MTGEITLTGQVLPIGGLREKSLAAQRAGLKRVIFPRENEPDLDELPPETREALEFIPADTIEDVFAAAFDGQAPRAPRGAPQRVERAAASARAKLVTSCEQTRRAVAACAGRAAGTRACRAGRTCTRRRASLDVDLVGVRAHAARGRPSCGRDRPARLARDRRHPRASSRATRAKSAACRASSSGKVAHLDELRAVRGGRPAAVRLDRPARGRLEAEARARARSATSARFGALDPPQPARMSDCQQRAPVCVGVPGVSGAR